MTFKRFEDIESWQLARDLCKQIKSLTDRDPFSKDWTLRNQIRASSGSVMDCIAEGHERGHNKEFIYFLGIAKGSCGETRSQIYRAYDFGYVNQNECEQIKALTFRIGGAIQALIRYLNNTEIRGIRSQSTISESKNPNPSQSTHYFPETPPF